MFSPKCGGCSTPTLGTKECRHPNELVNASAGTEYLDIWHTVRGTFCIKVPWHIWECFGASFIFPYATEPLWTKLQYRWQGSQVWLKKTITKNKKINQESYKYQRLWHECKLQLSLAVPCVLLPRQSNTSSCLAGKRAHISYHSPRWQFWAHSMQRQCGETRIALVKERDREMRKD